MKHDQNAVALDGTQRALRTLTHDGVSKQVIEFPKDGVVFSSRFDGGSMAQVARIDGDEFHVTLAEDAPLSGISTGYTTWFYFEVLIDSSLNESLETLPPNRAAKPKSAPSSNNTIKNGSARELTIVLTNMNNQRGLFSNGYTVMHCVVDENSRLAGSVHGDENELELVFDNERKWMRLPTPIVVEKYTHTVHKTRDNNAVGGDETEERKPRKHKTETKMRLTFTHHIQFRNERVRFAFCYPYTYSKLQRQLTTMDATYTHSESIYYHRDVLTHSLGGLPIDLITISSMEARLETKTPTIPGLFPVEDTQRASAFDPSKTRTVFLTARVHPGETPANFILDGMLRLLLHPTDENALALRRHFVFKIVPVLNPDGVCQGFYRTDRRGVNLNRVYEDPHLEQEPAVYAVKQLLLQTTLAYGAERAREHVVYLDLHAHANHRGGFVYGNSLLGQDKTKNDYTRQVQTQLYAKLASLHSPFFDYGACSFDAENMVRHDARDNNNATTSREGSSRVALYRATDLTYVYTIECNYNEGRRRLDGSTIAKGTRPSTKPAPDIASTPAAANKMQRHAAPLGGRLFHKFSPPEWTDVGIGCLLALLDLFQVTAGRSTTSSVVAASPYRTLDGVKKSILSDLKANEVLSNETASGSNVVKAISSSSKAPAAMLQSQRVVAAAPLRRKSSSCKL